MGKYIVFILTAIYIVLTCPACKNNRNATPHTESGDTISLRYSDILHIVTHKDYTTVTMCNPWDTLKALHTYILIDKNKPAPSQLPEGTVIQTPLENSLVYSSVHCSILEELHALNCIKGVCDIKYIRQSAILGKYRKGEIIDAGNSMSPDIEKIIEMNPDAILLSPFENSGGYGQIEKLNVPIIECADYMESTPLGRAEWMRFFGMLFDREKEADSLFHHIENGYLALKKIAATAKEKPTVFSELKSGSAWYVAGGRSSVGQLFKDAGADYIFSYLPESGSVPLSFETVFDKCQHAEFWFIKYNQKYDKTYRELKTEYAPYAHFDAFKKQNIYGCNTKNIDFYEKTPFHPESLLKDYIKIFHPSLLEGYRPKYFSKLPN